MPLMVPLAERFRRYAIPGDDPDDCWTWTASFDGKGYGQIGVGGRGAGVRKAHRVSYEVFVGPIPPGMHVLHRCDNPPCCNPRHLFIGTNDDNIADMIAKGRHSGGPAPPGDANPARMYPGRLVRGDRQHLAKLTDESVRSIRAEYATGTTSVNKLSAKYSVNKSNIARIIRREAWRHVE